MIGAAGRVASAVTLGISALRQGLAGRAGLVSELPPFCRAGLVDAGSILVGGHELRNETIAEAIWTAHRQAGLFSRDLIEACLPDLRAAQRRVRKGTAFGASAPVRRMLNGASVPADRSASAAVERLSAEIHEFKRRHRLDLVVVVNLASCEPLRGNAKGIRIPLNGKLDALPASSLYALAAVEARCPYINFTPSAGIVPAIRTKADAMGVPYMGNDGKTGETLVKSALAPMFAMRNLPVMSWIGHNILGNRDGEILRDPGTRAAKLRTKDRIVSQVVPGSPTTQVSIEYVPSLDDWKVAWDHIHFEGFLGTKMAMQFTWQGCDSMLAAPLIIDLVRFTALEVQRGAAGPMRHLAFFFKDPMGAEAHDLPTQWQRLVAHVRAGGSSTADSKLPSLER